MKRTARDILSEALTTGKITPETEQPLDIDEQYIDPGPSYSELLDALHAALVCIADNPTFWAEERLIRNLLKRAEPYTR